MAKSSRRNVVEPAAGRTTDQRALVQRVGAIDVLRGAAIAAMIVYHFAYDLRLFGVTRSDFENDPFWIAARRESSQASDGSSASSRLSLTRRIHAPGFSPRRATASGAKLTRGRSQTR